MRSIPDVIDMLGGAAVVAAARALPYTTVASWKARRRIPAGEWRALRDLARQRKITGLTLERLEELHAAQGPSRVKTAKKRAA